MKYLRLLKDKKVILLIILMGFLYLGFSFTRGAFSEEVKLPPPPEVPKEVKLPPPPEVPEISPITPKIPEVRKILAASPLVLAGPVPAIPREEE